MRTLNALALPALGVVLVGLFGVFGIVIFAVNAIEAMHAGTFSTFRALPYLYYLAGCVLAVVAIAWAGSPAFNKPYLSNPGGRTFVIEGTPPKIVDKSPSGLLFKAKILAVIITTLGSIVVALLHLPSWEHRHDPTVHLVGIVVDLDTNIGIGQAQITLVDFAGSYVTEDDGRFTINVDALPNPDVAKGLRARISKKGYKIRDLTLTISMDPHCCPN